MPPIHADEMDGAVGAVTDSVLKHALEKAGELFSAHFAGRHRELAMTNRPCPETWPSIGTLYGGSVNTMSARSPAINVA
jgi:hypothetical protein